MSSRLFFKRTLQSVSPSMGESTPLAGTGCHQTPTEKASRRHRKTVSFDKYEMIAVFERDSDSSSSFKADPQARTRLPEASGSSKHHRSSSVEQSIHSAPTSHSPTTVKKHARRYTVSSAAGFSEATRDIRSVNSSGTKVDSRSKSHGVQASRLSPATSFPLSLLEPTDSSGTSYSSLQVLPPVKGSQTESPIVPPTHYSDGIPSPISSPRRAGFEVSKMESQHFRTFLPQERYPQAGSYPPSQAGIAYATNFFSPDTNGLFIPDGRSLTQVAVPISSKINVADLVEPVNSALPNPASMPDSVGAQGSPETVFEIKPAFASLSTPNFPNSSTSNCTVVSKGFGVFSRLSLPVNAVVLVERPVVVLPSNSSNMKKAIKRSLDKLDKETLNSVLDLAKSSLREDVKSAHDAVMKLMSKFCFGIGIATTECGPSGKPAVHKGLFLHAGRINHSCSPNTRWQWDSESSSLVLKSVRPIVAGEEITIAYILPYLTYRRRRDVLLKDFGFHCICASCVRIAGPLAFDPMAKLDDTAEILLDKQIDESDAAREMLSHFWAEDEKKLSFTRWCEDLGAPDGALIEAHSRALAALKREGLEILDCYHHIDVIAMCYAALEDADNFKLWISKAAEARGLVLGTPSVPVSRPGLDSGNEKLAFANWLANPMSFPIWAWRTRGPHYYS